MTVEEKTKLANIEWRASEGVKSIDKLLKVIDISDNDEAIIIIDEIRGAWLDSIRMTAEGMLEES